MTKSSSSAALLSVLDQIRATALEGLKYAKDPYEVERYNKLLSLTANHYAELLDMSVTALTKGFLKEIGTVTPKIGADVAIVSTDNKLLILKRTDDQTWCLPCGWVDVGESPADAAVRETKEETGMSVTPKGYMIVSHKGPHTDSHLQHQINIVTLMEPVKENTAVTLSHEHSDFRWITSKDAVDWHPGHDIQVRRIFDMLNKPSALLPIL